jgi:hypothetical protein
MVAYSYKKRFVPAIALGLDLNLNPDELPWLVGLPIAAGVEIRPKRQTIRADRKRHARPGEDLQHYCGMRTKGCFLIGRARCVYTVPITIEVLKTKLKFSDFVFDADAFAQSDGFSDADDMHDFWLREHGPGKFEGVLIRWEPI